MPNESGDNAVTDISELSFWSKLSICGIESAQSKLSTIRKLGCSLIANLAINSNNQNGKTLTSDSQTERSVDQTVRRSLGLNFKQGLYHLF